MPAAGAGGLGVVGLLLYLVVGMLGGGTGAPSLAGAPDADADLRDFVGFLSEHVQGTWQEQFAQSGGQYRDTVVVLFDSATPTGCGMGSAQTGPFYCPADQ